MTKTAIHTKTKEEYDKLMDIYEKKGWRWRNGQKPKKINRWGTHEEGIYIAFHCNFQHASILYFKENGYKILSFDEFLQFNEFLEMQELNSQKCAQENKRNPNTGDLVTYPGDHQDCCEGIYLCKRKHGHLIATEDRTFPEICFTKFILKPIEKK